MIRTTFDRYSRLQTRIGAGVTIGALALGLLIGTKLPTHGDQSENTIAPGRPEDMTLTKFSDIEVQEFPWGWIRWTMNAQLDAQATMTLGVVHIKPHQTNPLHLHPTADEILHVIEGSCEHRKGDAWVKMGPGDTIRIPRGVPHNARTGDQPCTVVVVFDTGHRTMVTLSEDSPGP